MLLPNREEIRPLVDQLLQPPPTREEEISAQQEQIRAQEEEPREEPPEPQPVASVERQQLVAEAARIVVHNGTLSEGLAVRTTEWLESQGFLVVSFGHADSTDYPHTVLVDYTGKQFTLQRLADLFGVLPENVRVSSNLKSQVDFRLILGQDWQVP